MIRRAGLIRSGVGAILALAAMGCDDFTIVCISAGATLGIVGGSHGHAIVAEVRDLATGMPAAAGATMLVRTAAGEEAVQESADGLVLAWGGAQSGTFDVTIRKPGYAEWHRAGVQVAHGGCRPGGAFLQVWLRFSD